MSRLYFVPNLEARQLERLVDGEVKYCEQTLDVPKRTWGTREQKGILLDAENYERALVVLGAQASKLIPLVPEDTSLVTLRFDLIPSPVVAAQCWHGGKGPDPAPFKGIVREILLPASVTDVVLHVAGTMTTAAPVDDGQLHIFIWSARPSSAVGAGEPPIHLWQHALPSRAPMYRPLDDSRQLVLDDDDTPVGEIYARNNVYCYVDLIRTGELSEVMIFRRFCEEVAAARTLDDVDLHRRRVSMKTRSSEQAETQYLAFCSRRSERMISSARASLLQAEQRLQEAQALYLAASQAVEREEQYLLSVVSGAESAEMRLRGEWRLFQSDPKFVEVVPCERGLKIYTRTLYCLNPKSRKSEVRKIGEMRIEILLDRKDAKNPIRIFNMTQIRAGRSNDYPHPHVNTSGMLCYGNSSSRFVQLVEARELYAAAILAVQFIQTVNPSSPYQAFSCWPIVEDPELSTLRTAGLLPLGA